MTWREALAKLGELDYSITPKQGKIAYQFLGEGDPDPAQVHPLLQLLTEHRKDVLTALTPAQGKSGILNMTLKQFRGSKSAIRINSTHLGREVWFVSDGPNGPEVGDDSETYTAIELAHLLKLRVSPEELEKVSWVKRMFKGAKVTKSGEVGRQTRKS